MELMRELLTVHEGKGPKDPYGVFKDSVKVSGVKDFSALAKTAMETHGLTGGEDEAAEIEHVWDEDANTYALFHWKKGKNIAHGSEKDVKRFHNRLLQLMGVGDPSAYTG